jgi:hypothetical protein
MQELIGQLVQQLGINPQQAQGGAGLLLKLAKDKLGGDFGQVEQAVPGVGDLIGSAPQPAAGGGLGGMLGGLAGKIGGGAGGALGNISGLASLAAGFSQLKLDPSLIAKFAPIILAFVKSKGGDTVAALLASVMKH